MTGSQPVRCNPARGGRGLAALWRRCHGAQLLEFALVLPLLVALAVAVADLGGAFVTLDKLTNAAREGARIGIGKPTADLMQADPLTVQSIRDAVVTYLDNAGVNVPTGPLPLCSSSLFTWTYCGGGLSITIERQHIVIINGILVFNTRVTVSFPYNWMLGRVLPAPPTPGPGPDPLGGNTNSITLRAQAVMRNLT